MMISDSDFQELYEYTKDQRDRYQHVLKDIVDGVPTIAGMASEYRQLTLKEIKSLAAEALKL